LERAVRRSTTTSAKLTVPNGSKAFRKSSSVELKAILPTYIFIMIVVSQMEIVLIESRPSTANFKECSDNIEGEEYFTFKR
jgi:hypothetical protein